MTETALISRLDCKYCLGYGEIHIDGEREWIKDPGIWYEGLGSVEDCEKCSNKAKCLDCNKEFADGEEIGGSIQCNTEIEFLCPHCHSDNWRLI